MRNGKRYASRPERPSPLFAPLLGVVAAAMAAPMVMAMMVGDEATARAFLYGGLFTGFSAATLGVALASAPRLPQAQSEILTLLMSWLIVPAFAALPLLFLTPQIGHVGAWFEMVAAFTTTGSTAYLDPERLPGALHLWRGIVSWLGGLVTLMAAYVVLAPRRLGGFEVTSAAISDDDFGESTKSLAQIGAQVDPARTRVRQALRTILPVYGSMTLALMMLFGASGESGLPSAVHAMGIVSTSGVSPLSDGFSAVANLPAEGIAALFLLAAATRHVYAGASPIGRSWRVHEDPELKILALLLVLAVLGLFLRHWLGALTIDVEENLTAALRALWGTLFTTLSYLTTTGYESAAWAEARAWSGLQNPGLILLGLCAIGGGCATTVGGIKLIRAYALLQHGTREIGRLAQPAVVLGVGGNTRGLLRQGAFVAWTSIMLFTATIFAIALALTITGLNFQTALTAAISAVTNCGPAFDAVNPQHQGFALLGAPERVILAVGMVLGRIEALTVIALFNRDAWHSVRRGEKKVGNA